MKVPLLDVIPPPEFGEVHADPDFANPSGADFDHTYVPGFSDMRRDRDLAIGKMLTGHLAAKDVPTLPVNLRWVRAQKANGEPDNTKLWTAGQRGYTPVTADQVGKEAWLKTLPLGAVKDSAGMIRNGDTVLCVATAQRAGLNEQRKQQRTAAAMQSATESFANELAKQKVAAKGAEPYVEATVAERPPVPRRKSRKES